MPSAENPVGTGGLITAHAVVASVAHAVIDGRNAIATLDRSPCPVSFDPVTEFEHAATHLMTRHRAVASTELAPPDMDLRTANIGLCHVGNKSSGWRRRNIVLVEIDFVGRGYESDLTFHWALRRLSAVYNGHALGFSSLREFAKLGA
jgi:hypothetical protein